MSSDTEDWFVCGMIHLVLESEAAVIIVPSRSKSCCPESCRAHIQRRLSRLDGMNIKGKLELKAYCTEDRG